MKWQFTSVSWATTKCQTFELAAGESVMSEIPGTRESGRQKNDVWNGNLLSKSFTHVNNIKCDKCSNTCKVTDNTETLYP